MEPLSEPQVRASFVNATKGEAKRLRVPDLADQPWDDLDYLGWVDPRAPLQAYLVLPTEDGPDENGLAGVQLRRNAGGKGPKRARMCSLCLTTHSGSGVSLMVAPRAGQSGRDGNSVGIDVCADLACSRYVRGLLPPPSPSAIKETLSVDERVARLVRNTRAFVDRVRG